MNIDETRRKLRVTEQELADTKRALKSAQYSIERFREQLSERETISRKIVGMLFPDHDLRPRLGHR